MIQQYLNPFYRPQALRATYGLCSWTHLSERAGKIQNAALRVVALAFAVLFDATLGFGIIGTLSYNSGALLYNAGSKVKHLYQKYRGIEESSWNKTALKTWGLIGSISLFGVLSYYGVKHWNSSSSETAITPPSDSFSQKVLWATLLGVPTLVGIYYLGSYLIDNDPETKSSDDLKKYTVEQQKKICLRNLIKEGVDRTYIEDCDLEELRALQHAIQDCQVFKAKQDSSICNFSISKLSYLPDLVKISWEDLNKCNRSHENKNNNPWMDSGFIHAADRWMTASFALSFFALKNLEVYAKNVGKTSQEVMNDRTSLPFQLCSTALKNYRWLRFRYASSKRFDEIFYQGGNRSQPWRNLHNKLCGYLAESQAMSKWDQSKKEAFLALDTSSTTFGDWSDEEKDYFSGTQTATATSVDEKNPT